MFLVVNNEVFKCTELNVTKILVLDTSFYRGVLNIIRGTAKTDNKKEILLAQQLVSKGYINIAQLPNDDGRAEQAKWQPFRNEHECSPTEIVFWVSHNEYFLVKHPEGTGYVFCVYDNDACEHFTISKVYSSKEECEEARNRILEHCNHIYFELPKEDV